MKNENVLLLDPNYPAGNFMRAAAVGQNGPVRFSVWVR